MRAHCKSHFTEIKRLFCLKTRTNLIYAIGRFASTIFFLLASPTTAPAPRQAPPLTNEVYQRAGPASPWCININFCHPPSAPTMAWPKWDTSNAHWLPLCLSRGSVDCLLCWKVLNISVHFFKSRFLCQEKWEPGSGFPCLVVNIIIIIIIIIVILTTIIIIIIVSQDILVWRWWTPSSFLQSSSSFNEWWLLSTRISLFGGASPPITHSTLSLSVNSIVPQLSNYLTSSFNSVSLVAIFFLLTFLTIDTNDANRQLLNWQYSNMINCMLDFAFINI